MRRAEEQIEDWNRSQMVLTGRNLELTNAEAINERPALGETQNERIWKLRRCAGRWLGQGRYIQAELLYRQALLLAEVAAGPDSIEVARICNNLGVVYKYTAKFDEAEQLYRRALSILERELGTGH